MTVGQVVVVGCYAALWWLYVIYFDRIDRWQRRTFGVLVRPTPSRHSVNKVMAAIFAAVASLMFVMLLLALLAAGSET